MDMLKVRIPIKNDAFLSVLLDVVDTDILLLIGLNELKRNGFY